MAAHPHAAQTAGLVLVRERPLHQLPATSLETATTFEAIRCLTGHPSKNTVIDSDVWPDQIDLLVEDQAGQIHHVTRVRTVGA